MLLTMQTHGITETGIGLNISSLLKIQCFSMIMDLYSQTTMLKVEEQLFFDQGIISITPAHLSIKDFLIRTIFDIKSTLFIQSNLTESVSRIMQVRMMIALGLILFELLLLTQSQMLYLLRISTQQHEF